MRDALMWLLYQMPEATMMLYCGTRLLGLHPRGRRFWLAALVFAAAIPLARLFFQFGLHTAVLFVVYVAVFAVCFRVSLLTALVSAIVANVLLMLGDLVVIPVAAAFRLSLGSTTASLGTTILLCAASASVIVVTSLLVYFFRIKLISVPEALSASSEQA